MSGDKTKSSSVLFLIPIVIWLITGYPLRQFLPERTGLLVAGGGLSFSLYLLVLQFLLYSKMCGQVMIPKKLLIYSFLWVLYLTWGVVSNLGSAYGSLLYQLVLIAGVLTAFLFAIFHTVPLASLFRVAFWTAFPFTVLWWANWLGSGLVTDITYRNPSYGVISLAALCSATYLFRFPFRTIIQSLILISLFFNEHRTSLFAGIIVVFLQAVFHFRSLQCKGMAGRKSMLMYIGIISLMLVGILVNVEEISPFVLEDVLLWNDPHRGVSSGLSYRFLEWKESLRLFFERPILGWGTRANEVLLRDLGPIVASSTHNGILANLVDYGLPGAILSIILMVWPICLSTRQAWMKLGKEHLLLSTLGISYMVLGMGERYWFSVGNPTSVILLVSLFYIMANEQ
ncbi:hypothetical protein DRN74_04805 [Candidatus Micrarchaeota archaeon]|nr:MAG: hypothetical protein DRN74_04805 [Candidatus Micrarchaeota archaeon]